MSRAMELTCRISWNTILYVNMEGVVYNFFFFFEANFLRDNQSMFAHYLTSAGF